MPPVNSLQDTIKDARVISVLPPSSKDKQAEEKPVDIGPLRNKNGLITQAGMKDVIAHGGSVSVGDRVYTRIEDLPTDDQMNAYYNGVTEHHKKIREELVGARR